MKFSTHYKAYCICTFFIEVVLGFIPGPWSMLSVVMSWIVAQILYAIGYGIHQLYKKFAGRKL